MFIVILAFARNFICGDIFLDKKYPMYLLDANWLYKCPYCPCEYFKRDRGKSFRTESFRTSEKGRKMIERDVELPVSYTPNKT